MSINTTFIKGQNLFYSVPSFFTNPVGKEELAWRSKYRARICKPFKEPRNRFPAWQASTTYRPATPQRLAESIPGNWFILGSLNVYKFGLSSAKWSYSLHRGSCTKWKILSRVTTRLFLPVLFCTFAGKLTISWIICNLFVYKVFNAVYLVKYGLDLQSLFELQGHSCTHWLRQRNPPPPPAFGLIYEGAIDQPR